MKELNTERITIVSDGRYIHCSGCPERNVCGVFSEGRMGKHHNVNPSLMSKLSLKPEESKWLSSLQQRGKVFAHCLRKHRIRLSLLAPLPVITDRF